MNKLVEKKFPGNKVDKAHSGRASPAEHFMYTHHIFHCFVKGIKKKFFKIFLSFCMSYPIKLWKNTGILYVFRSLKLHDWCAAPRNLPV